MTCGIYGIRNDINGKWYIGQAKNIEVRNRCEKRNIERGYIHPTQSANVVFNRAINKYGASAFSFHVIEECPEETLDEKEIYYIKLYHSKVPTGYNLTDGGTSGTKGYKFTPEQRKKMSDVQKQMTKDGRNKTAGRKGADNPAYGKPSPNRGKKRPREIVEKALRNRKSFAGDQNPNFGKHATDEMRAIWHEQRAGRTLSDEWRRHISENSKSAKAVLCVETGVVYRSCVEAAKENGIRTPRNIGDVCRGKFKTCGGKRWRWVES